jgi:hypothetical protein
MAIAAVHPQTATQFGILGLQTGILCLQTGILVLQAGKFRLQTGILGLQAGKFRLQTGILGLQPFYFCFQILKPSEQRGCRQCLFRHGYSLTPFRVKWVGSYRNGELRAFEEEIRQGVRAGVERFFEGCLPIEILAERGREALAFGSLRPVGLINPRTGKRPYAVVQLRQDNLIGDLYNMVGFQTNLKFSEQQRVFRMIPGLERAEFVRYGQMHRNTFIASPRLLLPTLQSRQRPDLFFAGQITGVEGYMGNIATGLLAGWNAARLLRGQQPVTLPAVTMLGALCHYVTHASLKDFQPMKANFGILPPLASEKRLDKRAQAQAYVQRALSALEEFLVSLDETL